MKTNEMKKERRTVESIRAEIERLEKEAAILKEMDDVIDSVIKHIDGEINWMSSTTEDKGNESEQATDSDGNLLFIKKDGYRRFTLDNIPEGVSKDDIVPYYRTVYETRQMTEEEIALSYYAEKIYAFRKLRECILEMEL